MVQGGIERASALGAPLFLHEPMTRALRAASKMQIIEGLTDAEIAEAHRSKDVFDEVRDMTAPLDALLSVIHALDWLDLHLPEDKAAIGEFLTGQFGDPVQLAMDEQKQAAKRNGAGGNGERAGTKKQLPPETVFEHFKAIWARVRELVREERFLNWQV